MCVFQDSELVPSILVSTAHVINIFQPVSLQKKSVLFIPGLDQGREAVGGLKIQLPDFVPHGHCHSY